MTEPPHKWGSVGNYDVNTSYKGELPGHLDKGVFRK